MHPMERLRYVARATGADQAAVAAETANSLGMFNDDPAGLVTVCRRMIAKHPTAGALWWLCSRVLASVEPMRTAWESADLLQDDPTPGILAAELPEGAVITVLGWPNQIGAALGRRGDLSVRVVDVYGEGSGLASRLRSLDIDVEDVMSDGLGGAVATSDLVVLEATAFGPAAFGAVSGSLAAASVARVNDVAVWLVAGYGRGLPQPIWDEIADVAVTEERWLDEVEVISFDLVESVVSPEGRQTVVEAISAIDCPVAAELLSAR